MFKSRDQNFEHLHKDRKIWVHYYSIISGIPNNDFKIVTKFLTDLL